MGTGRYWPDSGSTSSSYSANPTGPIHIGGVLPRDGQSLDDLGRARLWLADATRIVLANGLGLLGVTAPDRL